MKETGGHGHDFNVIRNHAQLILIKLLCFVLSQVSAGSDVRPCVN